MRRGDVTSETLDRLWLHDGEATVVTIRLTAAVGRTEVSACVRYQSREPLGFIHWRRGIDEPGGGTGPMDDAKHLCRSQSVAITRRGT
jgi:hypothetical protein